MYVLQVGSRRVVMLSAGFMIVFGLFTKFGALFVTIPDPVIAGTFFILFGETASLSLTQVVLRENESSFQKYF